MRPGPGSAALAAVAAVGVRLSKWMTDQGVASRREADDWIAAGWVRVDGQLAVLWGSASQDANTSTSTPQRVASKNAV